VNNISTHITYKEAVKTSKPFANIPNPLQLQAMKLVAVKVFEPLREHFDKPIIINSFFRSIKVNGAAGGAITSRHLKGEAIDIDATGTVTNLMLFNWIKDNLIFDQLIYEYGGEWVHFSYSAKRNRMEIIYT